VKTTTVLKGLPKDICTEDPDAALTAALSAQTRAKIVRAREQFIRGRPAFKPGEDQPRNSDGRFRKVLARLRYDLGDTELQDIVDQIKQAERANDVGDIGKATESSETVISMIDKIDEGVLDPESIKNVRAGAAELGRVLAYLPLPQGDPNAKVRFSDLPKSTRSLIEGMIDRVISKIGAKDAQPAVALLKSYMSGVRSMASDELSAELNKLLRLLT
jgi:ribosomal protein S20